MKYSIKVSITDPTSQKDLISEITYDLTANFFYDSEQYGNGYYLSISGKHFSRQIFDLRYDTSFNLKHKEEWLKNWCKLYWSGKNGSWKIKKLKIEKLPQTSAE